MTMIQIKRVYEPAAKEDGARFLVERLWPRGMKKEALPMDAWCRDAAPSDDLRRASSAISVGTRAPRKKVQRRNSILPKSATRGSIDRLGFGELAITVSPPPVTAAAITTYLNASENPGTRDARYVIAALSLKAVRIVAASSCLRISEGHR